MAECSEKMPEPSDTVKRLRETFAPLAEKLMPEDEPAIIYVPRLDEE